MSKNFPNTQPGNTFEFQERLELQLERERNWLKLIGLDKRLYDLYVKYPNALELIREMQEYVNELRRDITDRDRELYLINKELEHTLRIRFDT